MPLGAWEGQGEGLLRGRETLGLTNTEQVHNLDSGDGFADGFGYTSVKTYEILGFKYVGFIVCHLRLNKIVNFLKNC